MTVDYVLVLMWDEHSRSVLVPAATSPAHSPAFDVLAPRVAHCLSGEDSGSVTVPKYYRQVAEMRQHRLAGGQTDN
jgi:hypothetical protein